MKYLANVGKCLMLSLVLTGLAAQASAQGPGPVNAGPAAQAFLPNTGVNIDVPFNDDPVCGFAIIVSAATAPQNFYTGTRNPWGAPTVTQLGPGLWLLQFGGPSGPCFPRSLFFESGVFKGLHFGFHTSLTLVQFQNSPCWVFGVNGSTPCSGITGHGVHDWGVAVANDTAVALAVRNVQAAVSSNPIDINDLTRDDLDHLAWQSVRLESDIVPAGSEGQPGTLPILIPDNLRGQKGWLVFSYDIGDPRSDKVFSTVTLEFENP
jgi:hypothetical protein